MKNSYSIAEARDNLAKIVHEAENRPVELTRRGRSVAVLVSLSEYQRLQGRGRSLSDEIDRFREHENLADNGIEPDVFEGVRDRSVGRKMQW